MKWISYVAGGVFTLLSALLPAQEAPLSINGVYTINSYQAKRLHDVGALFIDVRPLQQWQFGHVKNAYNLDLQGSFSELTRPGVLDKNTPIVIYGNSNVHMRGAIGSYMAALWGYKRVFFLRDGYYNWLAMDYPVTLKSDQPARPEVTQVDDELTQ